MKRLAVVALVVLALALFYRTFGGEETATGNLTLAAPEPNIGSAIRTFTARDTEGDRFQLTDDGVYVLAFWSTLNQNSNRSRDAFIEVAQEYRDEASFAVIYVNGARRDIDAPYDRLHDPTGRLASRYNVKRVPRLFVIRDGIVTGTLDEYYEDRYKKVLERQVEGALKDEEDPQSAQRAE